MNWMEPFLESGQLAGKIICPNKKCGAKLGNYDWAGVCCGCKQWVTPVSSFSFSNFSSLRLDESCMLTGSRDSVSTGQRSTKWFSC